MGKEQAVFLFIKAAPCACRCRHCCFAAISAVAPLSLEQTLTLVQPFISARDTSDGIFRDLAVLLSDAPLNYPSLPDCNLFFRRNNIEGWYSIPANGFRYRQVSEWQPYLEALRESGTQRLEFTLYGQEDSHDQFSQRRGDFQAIRFLAHLWGELGGKTSWGVFIHKKNLSEIDGLRSHVMDTYQENCFVAVWSYLGRGAMLEDMRPEYDDIARLSEDIQQDLHALRSEREWVHHFLGSEASPYEPVPRVIHIVTGADGIARIPYRPVFQGHDGALIGELPSHSVGDVLELWHKKHDAWRAMFPSLGSLCEAYGNAEGTRVYGESSIKAKWCHLHLLSSVQRA
jgi:hypothetical protein